MIRPILRYGEQVLHEPARAVDAVTPEIDQLVGDMIDTMYAAPGIGLAAPQIGVPLRVFVVDITIGRDPRGLLVVINPEFVVREGLQLEEEGCLSVPGFNATVVRPERAIVKGLDLGIRTSQEHEGKGLLARAFQHEMDHLDGTLFVDRLRGIKRDLIVRKIRKLSRSGEVVTEPLSLRVVFFGTPQFAVPTLDALLASRHRVVGVVTQPDRPRGRGQRTADAPVKARALEAGLAVLQPASLKDSAAVEALMHLGADLGVVAVYGKILTDAILATPRLGMVNVHASLLPKYRGAAPVHRAIIAGEPETGVTIMRVVKALDAGPMLAKIARPIGEEETSAEVERDLGLIGAALLVDTVDRLAAGQAIEQDQDDSEATYAHRLAKDDGVVDWARAAGDIHNLVRGLHPWPHAFTFHGDRRLILRRSALPEHDVGVASLPEHGEVPSPGTVVQAHGDQLIMATGRGTLRLLEIQAEGGRPLAPREFLAGHRIVAGDRFAPRP